MDTRVVIQSQSIPAPSLQPVRRKRFQELMDCQEELDWGSLGGRPAAIETAIMITR